MNDKNLSPTHRLTGWEPRTLSDSKRFGCSSDYRFAKSRMYGGMLVATTRSSTVVSGSR